MWCSRMDICQCASWLSKKDVWMMSIPCHWDLEKRSGCATECKSHYLVIGVRGRLHKLGDAYLNVAGQIINYTHDIKTIK